jgi:hypothetical protein
MAAKTKAELEMELEQLKETVRRLATHAEVVAVAVRTPQAVTRSELDDAIAGIHGLFERFVP